ncbi:MAG: DUF2004 domain-containing protein [Bacteroidota bacterium]
MTKIMLPHIGEIDSLSLKDYYSVDVDFNGNNVSIDVNFEQETIEPAKLTAVKRVLENIGSYDAKNRKYILDDYNDEEGDNVKSYLQHHLEEFDEDTLSSLMDFDITEISHEEQLLKQLHLIRIGFYPDGDDHFITFDYSLNPDITNYLVVILTDENGELNYMTLES